MTDSFSQAESAFFEHLRLERGYPEQSLIRNMILTNGRGVQNEVDLVVVDPEQGDPLAVVEIKHGNRSSALETRAVDRVRSARYWLGKPGIPGFAVFFNGKEFRLISVTSSKEQEDTDIASFPSFSTLLLQARSGELIAQKKEQKDVVEGRRKTVDRFRLVCWGLAVLVLAALSADVTRHFTLTSQQTTLLGVFSALLLIPDMAKLKVLGVEFERHAGELNSSKDRKS